MFSMIKLYAIAALVLAFMGWFGVQLYQSYSKGVDVGTTRTINKVNKETEHVEAEWDRIESAPGDFSRSIGRLRDRARSRNR